MVAKFRELMQRRRRREPERQKQEKKNKQNNNFACASHLFVHFLAIVAGHKIWNLLISRARFME